MRELFVNGRMNAVSDGNLFLQCRPVDPIFHLIALSEFFLVHYGVELTNPDNESENRSGDTAVQRSMTKFLHE